MDTNMTSDTVNSLIHLYRGELGRMVSYRVRLDTTTNWAIVTNAGVVTLAFGNTETSHAVFIVAMLLTFYFLQLETRRYRLYELSHQRVRLLEQRFYPAMILDQHDQGWHNDLVAQLRTPRLPVSHFKALGLRLWRNYLWLQLGLLLLWLVKLGLFQPEMFLRGSFEAASLGNLPGKVVVLLVLAYQMSLVGIALWASSFKELAQD
jgi:uncharacterized membrane protein